jgi:hypothetical protein
MLTEEELFGGSLDDGAWLPGALASAETAEPAVPLSSRRSALDSVDIVGSRQTNGGR